MTKTLIFVLFAMSLGCKSGALNPAACANRPDGGCPSGMSCLIKGDQSKCVQVADGSEESETSQDGPSVSKDSEEARGEVSSSDGVGGDASGIETSTSLDAPVGSDASEPCECADPVAGGQLGIQVSATSPCPEGYQGEEQPLYSGLTTGDKCNGCFCQVAPIVCSVGVYTYCQDNNDPTALMGCETGCIEDYGLNGGTLQITLSDDSMAARCSSIAATDMYYRIGPLTSSGGQTCNTSGTPPSFRR